jgi:transcriptional regulator with XRE-family HTH domain
MEKQSGLIQEIRTRQDKEELTLTQMADRLQVDPATLSRVYNGKKKPGTRFLGGVLKAFPDLGRQVDIFLLSLVPEINS